MSISPPAQFIVELKERIGEGGEILYTPKNRPIRNVMAWVYGWVMMTADDELTGPEVVEDMTSNHAFTHIAASNRNSDEVAILRQVIIEIVVEWCGESFWAAFFKVYPEADRQLLFPDAIFHGSFTHPVKVNKFNFPILQRAIGFLHGVVQKNPTYTAAQVYNLLTHDIEFRALQMQSTGNLVWLSKITRLDTLFRVDWTGVWATYMATHYSIDDNNSKKVRKALWPDGIDEAIQAQFELFRLRQAMNKIQEQKDAEKKQEAVAAPADAKKKKQKKQKTSASSPTAVSNAEPVVASAVVPASPTPVVPVVSGGDVMD